MSLFERIIDISRSHYRKNIDQLLGFYKKAEKFKKTRETHEYENFQTAHHPSNETSHSLTQQEQDLSVFGLYPYGQEKITMALIKKKRNEMIKEYHSDRYSRDPEKEIVSKELMQIVNQAYDRLKKTISDSVIN